MLKLIVLLLITFAAGLMGGIMVQRFYPVGSILATLGLRDWLPVSRNVSLATDESAVRDWDVPTEAQGQLLLFVLMGQSNMSGRGSIESPSLPQPHPNVYVFNKDYRWYPAREPLGTMPFEPDWIARDGGTGVGPGLAFARALLDQSPDLKIGLIPCARGATAIEEWRPERSQNSLYGACLKRIRAASTYGTVAAVLFAQGESDADDPLLYPGRVFSADTWGASFGAIVDALRQDLSEADLPVLFTQLGDYRGQRALPNWDAVKRQQAKVDIDRVIMVKTADLPLEADAHFSTESQVEIGRRFSEAYRKLQSETP